jgi:hypothetical protein
MTTEISSNHLKNRKFRFTSSEMLCFAMNLPFMIGGFISEDDPVWIFFIDLLKILDIIMEPEVLESNLKYLDALIEQHHKFYTKYFKDELKPKHHFMVHYSNVIRKVGPLKPLWCMRLEGYHKELKKYASAITSRRNLAYSIMSKEQLKLSQRFRSQTIINWNDMIFGQQIKANDFISLNIPPGAIFYNWIKVNGIRFEKNLIVHFDNDFTGSPIIATIFGCCVTENDVALIVKKTVNCMGYNEHFHCYVAREQQCDELFLINVSTLISFPSFLHRIPKSLDFGFNLKSF